jgi:hypothetical protein
MRPQRARRADQRHRFFPEEIPGSAALLIVAPASSTRRWISARSLAYRITRELLHALIEPFLKGETPRGAGAS